MPLDDPFVPRMYDPVARMSWMFRPIPPADFEIVAHSLSVSKMPSMESSFMRSRKHDDSCGRGVPELNSVGLACVNQRSLIRWYVLIAASTSSWWMPMDTRISMCCGRSTTRPLMRSRKHVTEHLQAKVVVVEVAIIAHFVVEALRVLRGGHHGMVSV
eukprot:366520-Chlamydomonas_euryale.AAC.6